jgi:mono/diheme cytochrome c family protein
MTPATLLLLAALPWSQAADTGQVLFGKWCGSCHGADGRGVSKTMTKLEVPAADLASCANSTSETEAYWVGIVANGGSAFGLSIDMPAFGENATTEQIRAIVRYARSLCTDRRWPPGELNFPRAFLAEKAFPENELVLTEDDREQELIYERRFGPRVQIEAVARSLLDGGNVFGGVTGAFKYNVYHNLEHRLIASLGTEVTPPIGRQDLWEGETYLAFGAQPGSVALQGEAIATWQESTGFAAFTLNLGLGHRVGRFVPQLEGAWTVPRGGTGETLALVPQLWFRLSRLGHVAGSLGVEVPAAGPQPRGNSKLVAFLLWDFGDAPLNRGW